jgi:hypothetical protein
MLNNVEQAKIAISNSYDKIVSDCRKVLGSELHYQAMIYHVLRIEGLVSVEQIGMNVKTTIKHVKTQFLKDRIAKKNINYQSDGIEIIPDISIYHKSINADWRRRNFENTLKHTLYSLEIKASERQNGRLTFSEIKEDVLKLKAQFDETKLKHGIEIGLGMMIIDVAPTDEERMKLKTLEEVINLTKEHDVDLWYFNREKQIGQGGYTLDDSELEEGIYKRK